MLVTRFERGDKPMLSELFYGRGFSEQERGISAFGALLVAFFLLVAIGVPAMYLCTHAFDEKPSKTVAEIKIEGKGYVGGPAPNIFFKGKIGKVVKENVISEEGKTIFLTASPVGDTRFVKWVNENRELVTDNYLVRVKGGSSRLLTAVFVYPGENDYKLSGFKYEPSDLPIDYVVNPYGYRRSLSNDQVVAAIKRACETWDKHVRIELFDNDVETTTETGVGTVYFKKNMRGAGQARFPEDFEILIGGDLSSREVYETALHEVGHTLGLDHSAGEGPVMHPSTFRTTLARGDILGLKALYGENALPENAV